VGGSRCHPGAYWGKSAAKTEIKKGKVSFAFSWFVSFLQK